MRALSLWPALLGLAVLAVVGLFSTAVTSHQPLTALALDSPAQTPPQVAGCDLFPADNIWNTPVDDLPLHPRSDLFITTIGAERGDRKSVV